MYVKSAEFYDQLYHFKDYAAAASDLTAMIDMLHPEARSLLDVACSTGRHLEKLQDVFEVQGLDISTDLLVAARHRLPHVPLHQGDMMAFDLGTDFDVVTCLFASIAYCCTVEGLARAITSLARHVRPGGLLFVEPWLSPEQYWHDHLVMNVSDRPERKIVWMYVGTEKDRVVTNDIHFLVGTPEGVDHFVETHQMGLFGRSDYHAALAAAGMQLVHEDAKGFFGNGLYVARKVTPTGEDAESQA